MQGLTLTHTHAHKTHTRTHTHTHHIYPHHFGNKMAAKEAASTIPKKKRNSPTPKHILIAKSIRTFLILNIFDAFNIFFAFSKN